MKFFNQIVRFYFQVRKKVKETPLDWKKILSFGRYVDLILTS